ncbi:hypothetical protein [Salmonella phage 3384-D8]|nr:hypothetical protein [Salmonella phage 3384-D8]
MHIMIRVSKKSKGAEKRLYKAIRLMIIYDHKADNHGWTKKYKERYRRAHCSMQQKAIKCIIKNWCSFDWWKIEAIGSRRFVDLEANRDQAFLVRISDNEELE